VLSHVLRHGVLGVDDRSCLIRVDATIPQLRVGMITVNATMLVDDADPR
jgi:hypothetical protein